MRSGTYFVRQYSWSTRPFYTILLATRHPSNDRSSHVSRWRTYLSSLGRVTVKPPVDSTRQRYWRSSSSAILCLEMSEHPGLLSLPLVFRAATFIFPLFDLFVYEPFDPAFIRSFTCPFVCRRIRSYILRRGVHCPIILPRSSHLVPTKLFLLLIPLADVRSEILTRGWCSLWNPDSWLPRKRAITILHFNT